MAPSKSPDEAERRQSELAQKSESMARELSQKREMRIRQDRVRHLADEPVEEHTDRTAKAPPLPPLRAVRHTPAPIKAEDRTLPSDTKRLPAAQRGPSMLDDVATELEELMRDLRHGWRTWHAADKITFLSALVTLIGTLLPWVSDRAHPFQIGLVSEGVLHAGLAIAAISLLVSRTRARHDDGARLSARDRERRARRTSLWHLLLGAASTFLCAYLLVMYGLQRTAQTQLEIRFGLYVTLAAGMGLSYGGFSRFWSRHE
jgi:hypothetical protein